jgi:ABC-type protease/lipase transport system fused ATPase/permease subunit
MSIADTVMVLREGRLEAFGPRDQVFSKLAAVPAQPGPAAVVGGLGNLAAPS